MRLKNDQSHSETATLRLQTHLVAMIKEEFKAQSFLLWKGKCLEDRHFARGSSRNLFNASLKASSEIS